MSKKCFLCNRNGNGDRLEEHHIFFGTANRKKSEKHGLVVMLCGNECHRLGKKSVHKCKETATRLHKYGQRLAMSNNGWTVDRFRQEFGKNYLDEEEFDESGYFIGELFF